ncbi:hypothetical protein FRC07_010163, partial [Ceratobasidium sp. 392]
MMDCLKELRLIGIESDSLMQLLPLIACPESRDDLSIGLSATKDAHAALRGFFLRTRVKTFHLYPPPSTGVEAPYWGFLPPVDNLLLLERFVMDEQSIWNKSNIPPVP